MFQAFRMQVRQILDGNKKWFVGIFLLAPVLLAWLAMASELGELKRRIDGQSTFTPVHPPSARRVTWDGEDFEFADGRLVVQDGRVLLDGRRLRLGTTTEINRGWITIEENGEIWIDESRAWDGGGMSIRVSGGDVPEFGDAPPWEIISSILLFLLYPQTICLLLALFYGSSALGSELDGKTLTYLWTRPVARWRIVCGKYLGIVSVLIPPTALSVCVSWFILERPGGSVLSALLLGAISGVLVYNAVFVLLGFIVPRRAMVLALLYAVIFEFILSFVPAMVNTFTVTYYLRSMVVEIIDLPVIPEIERIVGGASLPGAAAALTAMVAFGLGGASWLARRREYVVADEA